ERLGGTAMPVSFEALGIDRLSVRERLELIEQIWDSQPEHVNPDEVSAWHLAELTKRRAEVDAAPKVGKPWCGSRAGHEPASDPSACGRGRHPGNPRRTAGTGVRTDVRCPPPHRVNGDVQV